MLFLFIPNEVSAKVDTTAQARLGIFDARELQGHRVNLSGEWEFYWKQLLTPNDFRVNKTRLITYANVPHQWGRVRIRR